MKKVFAAADQYCRESDWKTLAVLKFCLLAMGGVLGMCLPEKPKKVLFPLCLVVYVGTLVPLLMKYIDIFRREGR